MIFFLFIVSLFPLEINKYISIGSFCCKLNLLFCGETILIVKVIINNNGQHLILCKRENRNKSELVYVSYLNNIYYIPNRIFS